MKFTRSILIFLFALTVCCAVKEMPPGGPEDKVPPNIIGINPENGSTMIAARTSFRIRFSEPMLRDRMEGTIFLSPVFWDYPNLEWSGNELVITPPQDLQPNTTYILTIGADASDSRGNKLGQSRSFAFSTGPVIDSGAISGSAYFEGGQRVFYDIWAYPIHDTIFEFVSRIPSYATQVDSLGKFSLQHLGNGQYLVICIDDKNDDLFWDPSSEAIGLPSTIVDLSIHKNIERLVFRAMRRDTIAAYISNVRPIDRRKVSVEFSEPPDSLQKLNFANYSIRLVGLDSVLQLGSAYAGVDGRVIIETDSLAKGQFYRLIPGGLSTPWGNSFDTSGFRFKGVDNPDTSGPRLVGAFPSAGGKIGYQDSVVELWFSERISVLRFPEAVSAVADTIDTLQFSIIWLSPNMARLRFSSGLPRERTITISLNPVRVMDIVRNPMPDSAVSFSFRLPPEDTIGAVLAEIDAVEPDLYIATLVPVGPGDNKYTARFNQSGRMKMAAVLPGSYLLEFYEDIDNNNGWTAGEIFPFRLAEPFAFLPDTIRVRSRWETNIGVISLPNADN